MKTQEEIEQLAESKYGTEIGSIRGSNPYDLEADRKNGYIKGYTQCQEDMADKIKEAVNLLDKIVENTELFFGYDVANKNSNIRNAKIFIKSLNKQD
jgi:hypothetical protein